MEDDKARVHIALFESLTGQQLTLAQVELVDNLNGDVDSLPCLLELYAHLVHAVDDAFAALHRENCKFRRTIFEFHNARSHISRVYVNSFLANSNSPAFTM